jgi:nucleotidyltransferase substrate binding protein (TIGR01987 family)
MAVSLEEFEKALISLKEALDLYKSATSQQEIAKKAFRDACIQRFEYCIELCWKTSMKALGSNTAAAKPALREMARNNLIPNPDQWFQFIDARNETSHSYDENVALRVFARIEEFYPEAVKLASILRKNL